MSSIKYNAFISYRRSDGRIVANWLRRELETYRLPKKLGHVATIKLRIYLDTAYERGANDFYEKNIRPALLASQYLIVVATPDAVLRSDAKTDWMQRELNDFVNGPYGQNVIVVRGAGEFSGKLPVNLDERFPNIEILDLRGVGYFWYLNPILSSRLVDERNKLLAPLLNISMEDMPALRLEEEKRQQTRLGIAFGLSFAIVMLVASSSVFALKSLWKAQDALKSSMFSTERMIAAISDNLAGEDGPDGIRSRLLNDACDLDAKLAKEARIAPSIRERVLCEIERARGRESQKEFDLAESTLTNAISLAQIEDKNSSSSAAGRALVEARVGFVNYLLRLNKHEKARSEIDALLYDAGRLAKRHPDEPFFLITEADAYSRIASLLVGKEHAAARLKAIKQAARRTGDAAALLESQPDRLPDLLMRRAALIEQAARDSFALNDISGAVKHLREAVEISDRIRFIGPETTVKSLRNEAAIAERYVTIAVGEEVLGHVVQARIAKAEAVKRLAKITNSSSLPVDITSYVYEIQGKLNQVP